MQPLTTSLTHLIHPVHSYSATYLCSHQPHPWHIWYTLYIVDTFDTPARFVIYVMSDIPELPRQMVWHVDKIEACLLAKHLTQLLP